MSNIRRHSDRELSLQFLNTEKLYQIMLACDSVVCLREACNARFVYREEQFLDLVATWKDCRAEAIDLVPKLSRGESND